MDKDSLSHTSRYRACHVARVSRCRREVPCGETEGEVGGTPGMPGGQAGGAGMAEGGARPDHTRTCRRGAGDAVGGPGGRGTTMPRERHHERGALTGGDRTMWARGYHAGTVGLSESVTGRHVRRQPDGSRTGWRECPRRGPGGSGHRPVAAMPLS